MGMNGSGSRGRGGGRGRTPGQRAGLSREEVLACALRLAEEWGLEQLTMRRLAGDLGVAPNALYTYFADKTVLLDALFDAVLGEVEAPDPEAGAWQEALTAMMRASRAVLLAHPHLVSLFLTRPGGPNALRLGEATLRVLARGGVEGERAAAALRALLAYTLGFAALEAARLPQPERRRRTERALARISELPEGEFPETRSLSVSLATHPGEQDFEAGLRWLILGIAGEAPASSGPRES